MRHEKGENTNRAAAPFLLPITCRPVSAVRQKTTRRIGRIGQKKRCTALINAVQQQHTVKDSIFYDLTRVQLQPQKV